MVCCSLVVVCRKMLSVVLCSLLVVGCSCCLLYLVRRSLLSVLGCKLLCWLLLFVVCLFCFVCVLLLLSYAAWRVLRVVCCLMFVDVLFVRCCFDCCLFRCCCLVFDVFR